MCQIEGVKTLRTKLKNIETTITKRKIEWITYIFFDFKIEDFYLFGYTIM